MTCRKNVNSLTTEEKAALIRAIKALKANGKYNAYVTEHHASMMHLTPPLIPPFDPAGRNSAHNGPAFLPWHREFIRRFELDLQAEVAGVFLPYWDWATDASLTNPMVAPVWANDLMGRNDENNDHTIVQSGPFAYDAEDLENSWIIVNALGVADGGLARNTNNSRANNRSLADQVEIDDIQKETLYDSDYFVWGSNGYRNSNEFVHNRVHNWMGGSMTESTSPNDPIFFLHHCFVDKLWADWQAKQLQVQLSDDPMATLESLHRPNADDLKPINLPRGLTSDNLNGHRLDDKLWPWSTLLKDTLDHRSMGYSYDTDMLPTVTLRNTRLVFNDTPEGRTARRAATFDISPLTPDDSLCRELRFNITAGPTNTIFKIVDNDNDNVFTVNTNGDKVVIVNRDSTKVAQVWFSYTGTNNGEEATGTVEITCYQTGEIWEIELIANTITEPTVATVLVLDKSGSMDWDAGDGRKRIEVLKDSAPVFVELLDDDDRIGVVRFDSDAVLGTQIAVAGAAGTGSGRMAAIEVISNPTVGGGTSIGDGIEMASSQLGNLPAGSYDHTAIVVLTDGHETQEKWISDVAGIINNKVFAIGLGTAEQINSISLSRLTHDSGGYVLMTDTLDTNNDRFTLQKYFLQILSGVKNTEIVMDPEGWIQSGQEIRIPFYLNEADITADVILLTADVPPDIFNYVLETPSGKIIHPSIANASDELEFSDSNHAQFYRMTLPTAIAGFEEREGEWHAILNLNEKVFPNYLDSLEKNHKELKNDKNHKEINMVLKKLVSLDKERKTIEEAYEKLASIDKDRRILDMVRRKLDNIDKDRKKFDEVLKELNSLDKDRKKFDEVRTRGLRYSLNVHSNSDLRLEAQLKQTSQEPGGIITLSAQLTQYDQPLDNGASVQAELKRPNGAEANLTLSEVEPGVFNVAFTAESAGVYKVRILAKGESIQNNPFTREQLLSASVWIDDRSDEKLCHLLMCLLEMKSVHSFLMRQDIDPNEVSACLKKVCTDDNESDSESGVSKNKQDEKLCYLLMCLLEMDSIYSFLKRQEIDPNEVSACLKKVCTDDNGSDSESGILKNKQDEKFCHLLMCLLEMDSIYRFLKYRDINPNEVSECLKKVCADDDRPEF